MYSVYIWLSAWLYVFVIALAVHIIVTNSYADSFFTMAVKDCWPADERIPARGRKGKRTAKSLKNIFVLYIRFRQLHT
jgi:hypothetical protein